MTSRILSFRIAVLASAIAAGAAGAAVRYGLIEFKAIHDICAADVSAPCQVRSHVMFALMHTPALGLLALGLGFLALFGERRALVIAAIVTGALGLFLYNAGLGACGLLLGALRAVRD
jgi:hypothetical protein